MRIACDIGMSESSDIVRLDQVAKQIGPHELNTLGSDYVNQLTKVAQYLGSKGLLERQSSNWFMFTVTKEGMDEVEGNKPQPNVSNVFNISGPVHGSVLGSHNTTELTNHFDFRRIEMEIEEKGGADKEELREALAEVQRLLESGDKLDRGALARFSGVMERHSWFTGSVAQMILGFATQVMLG